MTSVARLRRRTLQRQVETRSRARLAVTRSEEKYAGLKTGHYSGEDKSVDDRKFREIAGRRVRDPEHDQGAIIMRSDPRAAMGVGGLQDLFGNQAGRVFLREAGKQRAQTLRAEFLEGSIFRFENTIGSEENNVTRLQVDGGLIVLCVGNQAEGDALEADDLHLTITDQERIGPASISESELPGRGVKNSEQHGNESRLKPSAEQPLIQ